MIKVNKEYIKIEGKVSEVCGELGLILLRLIEELGEEETKKITNLLLNEAIKRKSNKN